MSDRAPINAADSTAGDTQQPSAGSTSRRRVPRRASRPAAAGTDPNPANHALTARAAEDRPEGWGEGESGRGKPVSENDERLKLDKPPHWG